MTENEISYKIRGAIFNVYNNLGPGLLETVYVLALCHELKLQSLDVKTEVPVPVYYGDIELEAGFRLDILVANKVIIEVKSVEIINKTHHKQILTYLKLTGIKLGILVNFNTDDISKGIIRKVNEL
jgi:GxxExxY protein